MRRLHAGLYPAARCPLTPKDRGTQQTQALRCERGSCRSPDVLGDIADAIERTRRHALVDYFRHFDSRVPGVCMERRLEAFRGVCKLAGIDLPENIEAILVLDDHFTGQKSRQ